MYIYTHISLSLSLYIYIYIQAVGRVGDVDGVKPVVVGVGLHVATFHLRN